MQTLYHFHKKLIVRTPALPFKPENITEAKLKEICAETWFQEAIYLASPDLYRMSLDWIAGKVFEKKKEQKLVVSLCKYYSRMMSRCTPYGLFAACSVLEWGKENNVVLQSQKRQTRFDMHFSCALAQELVKNPIVKEQLTYYPNTSIYQIGDELRYIEYQYIDGKRMHQISAVTDSEYLQKVLQLSKNGATYADLIHIIIDDEISTEEAQPFIDQLIASQILVHNLEPSITGDIFTKQIINVLEKIEDKSIIKLTNDLKEIETLIESLDQNEFNKLLDYQIIKEKINTLNIHFEENKLFQTDLFNTNIEREIASNWQNDIEASLNVLNRLTPKKERENLKNFAKRFSARYEEQERFLLEVLDAEIGIGYLENSNHNTLSPLIENLKLPDNQQDKNISWNGIESFLFEKLKTANEQNQFSIEISEEDLKDLPEADWSDLPPSLSVMFRVVESEKQGKKILLENCSGSSSINLLGRFAHGNDEISAISKEIAEIEQNKNPDIIFAEIIHLPESRTGNILLHPVFRKYEIPFLGKSSLPIENQILLQDLYVSVKSGKIILHSKRLNKIVIPRLSNAHNYSYNALPVYQFLCDLQHQNLRTSFSFQWRALADKFKFLPRITYKNTIIEPASWNLTRTDITSLSFGMGAGVGLNFTRFMLLADGDNELLIDWQNPLSVEAFNDAIKNRESFQLKEFLHEKAGEVIKNKQNEGFVNQFIALLVREKSVYQFPKIKKQEHEIQRDFSIGSEWLYFKLYCGVKVADKILLENIKPLVDELLLKKLIDSWFFIRYSDPDNHLRVRFHLPDTSKIGEVIQLFYQFIRPAEEVKYIWKIQTETYARELERYGFENITLSEKLFFFNSQSILFFLESTEGDERENIRWLWGMKAVDDLLSSFQVNLLDKLALMDALKNSFGREFGIDLALKQQVDKKYRENRPVIEAILNIENEELTHFHFTEMLTVLKQNSVYIMPIVDKILNCHHQKQLHISLSNLLSSHIHMLLNRLIPANQRLHELLIYDFLFRHYKSVEMKKTKSAIQKTYF
ncbi:MAG: lantibiotic dehydratase [Emticicia sp.]|uniref:lantibiotic dehydratase n=1 Tax=Emticicia sp. TaxID=1930953 RepID=UPI003BA406DC